MGAARHVGRVGAVALALGLGTAVFSGYGIAAADTDTSGASATGSTPTSASADTKRRSEKKHAPTSRIQATREADHPGLKSGTTRTLTRAEHTSTLGSNSRSASIRPGTTAESPDDATDTEKVATATLHVVTDRPNPFSGDTPAPLATPAEWVAAAVARRELSTAPITASPQVTLTDAVVTGIVSATDTNDYHHTLTYSLAGKPDAGGKVTLHADTGTFTFLPDESVVSARGIETFTVTISEQTAIVTALQQIPVLGGLVQPVVVTLRQVPGVNTLLAPIIGISVVVPVSIDISEVVPDGTPIAFTTMVTSEDGTRISTNFFPALGLTADKPAPTIFDGPGLALPGDTNPWLIERSLGTPGIALLRAEGYNVVTWDPRGEFASGGVLQMNNPQYEAKDVSAIISWVAQRSEAQLDAAGDPRMGMVGPSYGGGIQLITAATDHRVDAIVPQVAWHTLNSSLYKDGAFRTSYGVLLALGVTLIGATINPAIYPAILTGSLLGYLSPEAQQILAGSGPGDLLNNITAPTLLLQGTVDVLFTLQEAITNAQMLDANGVPVKMVWYCGGHGSCLTPDDRPTTAITATMDWLDRYVKGDVTVDTGPKFEWIDQNGQYYPSDVLPSDDDFHGTAITVTGTGGAMAIVPLLGGSGPSPHAPAPFSFADGSVAAIAINTTLKPGVATQIVGAPELTITYSGLGTSTHIYAQLIDDNTGLVVGNLVTPISVTLDGQVHTQTVSLEAIAQTMSATDSLTLQLVGSATAYLNLTSFGAIDVSSVSVSLPTVAAGVATKEQEPERLLIGAA